MSNLTNKKKLLTTLAVVAMVVCIAAALYPIINKYLQTRHVNNILGAEMIKLDTPWKTSSEPAGVFEWVYSTKEYSLSDEQAKKILSLTAFPKQCNTSQVGYDCRNRKWTELENGIYEAAFSRYEVFEGAPLEGVQEFIGIRLDTNNNILILSEKYR